LETKPNADYPESWSHDDSKMLKAHAVRILTRGDMSRHFSCHDIGEIDPVGSDTDMSLTCHDVA